MQYEAQKIEDIYGITSNRLPLRQIECLSRFKGEDTRRVLEVFETPGSGLLINIDFPEFTCKCPRTGHPDFATVSLKYKPNKLCVELKALKYYLNSFRDEGHFHEEVTSIIARDLVQVLVPSWLQLVGKFNVRGGTYPVIECTYDENLGWENF